MFVGDAGTTEPAIGSRRTGITTTQDFVLNDWALLDVDYAWVRPGFFGGERIPNAVKNVLSIGLNLRDLTREEGANLGVRLRHYGPAALVEDNNARSVTTTVVNLQFGRQWRRLRLGVDIFDLFDSKDNDITYFYESQPACPPPRIFTSIRCSRSPPGRISPGSFEVHENETREATSGRRRLPVGSSRLRNSVRVSGAQLWRL